MSRLLALVLVGCVPVAQPEGGGVSDPSPVRVVDAGALQVPEEYRVDVIARDLDLPTGVTVDERGRPCVTEAGVPGGLAQARLVCLEPDGDRDVVARGDDPPWTGVRWHDGAFYVVEGARDAGRLLRVDGGGTSALAAGLPPFAARRTTGPAVHDGWVYVGQASADAACADPLQAATDDGLDGGEVTGALVPFGTRTPFGPDGALPCDGAVLRVPAAGGAAELVAWGVEGPSAIALDSDGTLLLAAGGRLLARDPDADAASPTFRDVAQIGAAVAIAPAPAPFGGPHAVLALVGDRAARDAARVLRVDPAGRIETFASTEPSGGPRRPVGFAFGDDGATMYLLDAGASAAGAPARRSGVLWRIRSRSGVVASTE